MCNLSLPHRLETARAAIARARRVRSLLAAWLLAACGGGDGTTSVTPGLQFSASPTAVTINAGSQGTISVSITRIGNLSTPVTLTAENLPAGVTVTFQPATLTQSTTSASASIDVASNATPGASSITVRASASGVSDQTASVSLTILPTPAVALAVTPNALTVQAGTNAITQARVTRTNFTGSITVTVDGAPAGVTATVTAPSLIADTTSITVSAATTAAPGSYTLIVHAASSLGDRTVSLSVVVTPPPDFALSLAPTSLSVQQGNSSPNTTVSITRSGGFTGAVELSIEGLPGGVTATLGSSSVAGSSTTLSLSATLAAATGTYTATVRGKASGLADRTSTLSVTVTLNPGAITVSTTPASLSVAQGNSGAVTVNLVRVVPFTGAVSLTVTGLPSGVTATFASTTLAAGITSTTLTFAAGISATTGAVTVTVRATGAGIAEQTTSIALTVSAAPTSLIAQHMLAQQGLAVALASTVLQTQLTIAFSLSITGTGSATSCTTLTGGGSYQSLPVGADNPTRAGIYFDAACTKPYMLATATSVSTRANFQLDIIETATYFTPSGATLGTLALTETAFLADTANSFVSGLGTFTPSSGAVPVHLGLVCSVPPNASVVPCYGGIEQNVPSLNRDLGSVTQLTLHIVDENSPITFEGNNTTMLTGPLNSLTLSRPVETQLAIAGGPVWGTSTQSGSAATFSLFPPTPTGWTVTDAAHDMRFTINVASNTVRNSVGTITQISTGAVLATIAVDQSGSGTVTWSDGSTAAISSWMFAN